MKVVLRGSLTSSLVALSLLSACSQKKSFAGGTPSAAAEEKTENVEPEGDPVEVPEPAVVPEKETANVFKDCETSQSSNFSAELYKLPVNTKKLPDFPSLTPVKKICLKQVDITNRRFTEGFPGVEGLYEWFALNINFNVKIEKAGEYKFKTISDDGSILIVDGVKVIDNDQTHSAKTVEGTINLTAGVHKMNLQYFQGPADEIALELLWTPPGASESYIPTTLVTRQ